MPYLILRSGAALALVAIGPLAGCGLISSDVTDFDLALQPKQFTIDASGWDVKQSDADMFTNLSCASDPSVCSAAIAQPPISQACSSECSASCNGATCDLSLDVSVMQQVDLVSERPELKSLNDQPLIKVAIDSVTYSVDTNTLNVATPEIAVYVAPMSVVTADSQAGATQIGTIESIAAGQVSGPRALTFTAAGKARLVDIMSSFKTPFNVLIGSSLRISHGQVVPMGKLVANVQIKGHAGL